MHKEDMQTVRTSSDQVKNPAPFCTAIALYALEGNSRIQKNEKHEAKMKAGTSF